MRHMKRDYLSTIVLSLVLTTLAHAADAPTTKPSERTTESGLKIVDVKTIGDAITAQKDDLVWVHYTGKLADGAKFDSSFDRRDPQTGELEPISFRLGQGRVIKGWDEGIAGMKVGEKRVLTIPPQLGYGAAGTPGGPIPPNATLVFDVELVGIYHDAK